MNNKSYTLLAPRTSLAVSKGASPFGTKKTNLSIPIDSGRLHTQRYLGGGEHISPGSARITPHVFAFFRPGRGANTEH